MNHTTKIIDCQDAVNFVPVNSLARLKQHVHFFSRVSTTGQDHRKYAAALEAAHNRLRLPFPFTFHDYTGCGRLDGNSDYFTWFAQKIQDTENIVCVFPALSRLFRPVGFDQFDPTTWAYRESDFELFRQKLADLGLNPEKITFALLNDGTLESDRAFETRLGENYIENQKRICKRIDPKTSERLKEEVRELGAIGMTVPDICFYMVIRLERLADRTVRGWYRKEGFPPKWENLQHEARGLAFFEGKNATDIHCQFEMRGETVSLRAVQYWVEGRESFDEIRQMLNENNSLF